MQNTLQTPGYVPKDSRKWNVSKLNQQLAPEKSVHIAITLIASSKWNLNVISIQTTFLQDKKYWQDGHPKTTQASPNQQIMEAQQMCIQLSWCPKMLVPKTKRKTPQTEHNSW